MATDNVTPIGPHAKLPSPEQLEARVAAMDEAARYFNAFAELTERVQEQRKRIFQAMGVIGCAAAVAPDNVAEGKPDIRYALQAAEALLDDVCTQLDPSHFVIEEALHG